MQALLIKIFIKDSQNLKNPKTRKSYGYLCAFFGIVSNVLLFILKLIVGLLINSIAVTADAFNNLSDAASSVVTAIGFKLSGKPADMEHPFGHGRFEYLSALVVAIMIMLVGIELVQASYEKIVTPSPTSATITTVVLLIISVFVKIYQSIFNRNIGKKINSSALIATATDSMNDVVATCAVIISIILGYFLPFAIDGYIGILVAIFILKSGFDVIKDTVNPILGTPANKELTDEVTAVINDFQPVLGTHDLVIHDYGPNGKFATVHIEISDEYKLNTAHMISDRIEAKLLEEFNLNATVHIDPVSIYNKTENDLKKLVFKTITSFDDALSFHDLRIVQSATAAIVYMDIIITQKYLEQENQQKLYDIISTAIQTQDPNYSLVIKYDIPFFTT